MHMHSLYPYRRLAASITVINDVVNFLSRIIFNTNVYNIVTVIIYSKLMKNLILMTCCNAIFCDSEQWLILSREVSHISLIKLTN